MLGHKAANVRKNSKSFILPTETSNSQTYHMPQQEFPTLSESGKTEQKGFTFAEKWIIWAVFCLLLALSTHGLIFPALQLASWGLVRWQWQAKQKTPLWQRGMAMLALIAGAALLYWAVILLRA
ncbi:MAG: hypothetical protein ACREOO_13735 [bacterium]